MSAKRYLNIPHRRKVLTKLMVEDAIKNTMSNASAAKWLGVSYNTYKKYSKMYNLVEVHKNASGKGIKKSHKHKYYDCDLMDVLSGKFLDYPKTKLKNRLVEEGLLEEKCSLCGWEEVRISDGKICLNIDFLDGDFKNYSFDNLRLLCPNCYFTNVGNFKNSKYFCK